jgi:uncharacterized protein YrrD
MAKRATNLLGKPVMSALTGERLGTVADLLLDDGGTSVVGFVLRHGWFKGEDVLLASSLQTLGRDAVVSRASDLISAREWHERQHASERPPERDTRERRSIGPSG